MTWDPKNRRWRKLYKGRRYVVSCRQLCEAETKESSLRAANEWWRKKLVEIEGETTAHPYQSELHQLDARRAWALQHDPTLVPGIEEKEKSIAAMKEGEMSGSLIRAVYLPAGDIWADRLRWHEGEHISEDQTVEGQVKRWLAGIEAQVKAGGLSAGTIRNKIDCIAHFENFLGKRTPIKVIDADRLEAYYLHLLDQSNHKFSKSFAMKCFGTAKAFIRYCVERGQIDFPKNFESRSFRFKLKAKAIPTLKIDDFQLLMKHATGQMPLHLLLMANCGMTQIDISELRDGEVDWDAGRIIRRRSKEDDHDPVPIVNYKLWPETIDLLRSHRSGGEIVLLTRSSGRWAYREWIDGKMRRTDNIASNYKWLRQRIEKKENIKVPNCPKHIRKTSATLLGSHPVYGRFGQHFLGQSPRTVADRYYVSPSQELFDQAITWLGQQYRVIG